MKRFLPLVLTLSATASQAYDGWTSQVPHALGGGLLAAGVTHMYRDSPSRSMIGFTVSTAAVVILEGRKISQGARSSGQYLDMASHAMGAAIGAWYTDKYLLMPVLSKQSVGVVYQTRF